MEVIRAAVSHRVQIEILENVEGLEKDGTLASETVFVNGVTAIGRLGRLLDLGKKLRKIGLAERSTVLPQEGDHFAPDLTFIEKIPCGSDAGRASLRFCGTLRFNHSLQSSCQTRQLYGFTRLVL